jgi:hypothetical protein
VQDVEDVGERGGVCCLMPRQRLEQLAGARPRERQDQPVSLRESEGAPSITLNEWSSSSRAAPEQSSADSRRSANNWWWRNHMRSGIWRDDKRVCILEFQ